MTERKLFDELKGAVEDFNAFDAQNELANKAMQLIISRSLGIVRFNNDLTLIAKTDEAAQVLFEWLESLAGKPLVRIPDCSIHRELAELARVHFVEQSVTISRQGCKVVLMCDSWEAAVQIFDWLDCLEEKDSQV